jgi:hypothetical protein
MFSIPLYGGSAAVHDLVTGHPGSFDKVIRALENLVRVLDPTQAVVDTVIVRQNVRDLENARAIADRFGFSFKSHLPFPSYGGVRDQYNKVALSYTEAVDILHGFDPPIPVFEAPPCVLLRHERRTGVGSFTQISPRQWRAYGRAYRSDSYLQSGGQGLTPTAPAIPCPSAATCAVADRCTRETYRAYVDLNGSNEFQAVQPDELDAVMSRSVASD